jgi:hypothetical protein
VPLKHRKNDRIAVYAPDGTILKEIAAESKLGQYFCFDQVLEVPDSTSYVSFFI